MTNTKPLNVLFLCTHNSARSLMAEAILGQVGKGKFNAYSAGSDPAGKPMPEVLARLQTLGHDVEGLRCKSWDEFTGPSAPRKFMGSDVERATMINELYGMIRRRLEIFINLPYASLDRMALKKRLDEIGDSARAPA